MTFEEINIRPGEPRYKLQNKIAWVVANTKAEEVIATALLMGAVFRQASRWALQSVSRYIAAR